MATDDHFIDETDTTTISDGVATHWVEMERKAARGLKLDRTPMWRRERAAQIVRERMRLHYAVQLELL